MNHIRLKVFSVSFLLLVLPLLLMSSPENTAKIQVRVLVTKANIRLEPTTDSTIITAAPRGTLLDAEPIRGKLVQSLPASQCLRCRRFRIYPYESCRSRRRLASGRPKADCAPEKTGKRGQQPACPSDENARTRGHGSRIRI